MSETNAPVTTSTDTATTTATTSEPALNTEQPTTTNVDTPATTTTETKPTETLLGAENPVEQQIQYTDFQIPEGFELNGDDSKSLLELGQQFKMPQEAVQKLVDIGVQMQQRQVAEQQQAIASWMDAAKADSEYGGDKLQQSLLTAQRAFSLPRGDKISKILHKSGLGNHPDVIGFMTEVGKLLAPDNLVPGRGANNSNVSVADAWYDGK